MRTSYVLVDYKNVHGLRTGALTLGHVADVRESFKKRLALTQRRMFGL